MARKQPQNGTLLTTTQAGRTLGIRPDTVSYYCQRGTLRGAKIGRDWVISAEEVERYLRERRPAGRPARG